jgi:hypothetical protein
MSLSFIREFMKSRTKEAFGEPSPTRIADKNANWTIGNLYPPPTLKDGMIRDDSEVNSKQNVFYFTVMLALITLVIGSIMLTANMGPVVIPTKFSFWRGGGKRRQN